MKLILSFFLFVFCLNLNVYGQNEPVVMEVDGESVTKSEFLQIYLKNNKDPKFDKQTIDEYMILFRKFKLKVAEAEDMGYDTIPKLVKELEGYKRQLANPYLIDSAANNELIKEAYERMKTEVRASHILIRVGPQASPKDTLIAWNKLMECQKRIKKGEPFSSVAKSKNGSEDPSVSMNGGDLGYFTAFQMVYPFEDAAYKTEVGELSKPIRTQYGYHLINVTDKRPARGKIKVAHIMIQAATKATNEEKESAAKKIKEIYNELQNGAKWDDLVSKYSEDPGSVKKNGELPMFGSGTSQRMVPEFEEAAFNLKENGEFSEPIKTAYGYHIIKRLNWEDIESFDELFKTIQSKVNKDIRAKKTQNSFVNKLKNQYGYKYSSDKNIKNMVKYMDSSYFFGKWTSDLVVTDEVLFELTGVNKKFTQKDFANYLQKNARGIKRQDFLKLLKDQFTKWEMFEMLSYEESLLEEKYPEYKALLKEYHDGIILYEIMSDEVWNKATKDTSGLRTFFNQNRLNYRWGERLDATIYECNELSNAKIAYKMLRKKKNTSKEIIERINAESELNLSVKMNKFLVQETPFLKANNFQEGRNKPFLFENKYYVVYVHTKLPEMNKELSETRGVVTSDYQDFLEKTWLEELEKKHEIKINYDVLYNLNK